MSRILVFLALVLPHAVLLAADTRIITLDEALSRAEDRSPGARRIQREIDVARSEINATGLWPNPEFFVTREESAGVVESVTGLTFPIPLGGRPGLEKEAARIALRATQSEAILLQLELRSEVRDSFTDLLSSQQRAASLETGLEQLDGLVAILRLREEHGEGSGFDHMRAAWERAAIAIRATDAGAQVERSRSLLASLISLPSEGLTAQGTLEPAGPLAPFDSLVGMTTSRADVVALDERLRRAELLGKSARRRRVPGLSLTAGARNTEAGNVDDTGPALGFSLAIPLFDRGQGEYASAVAEAGLLQALRDELRQEIRADAEAAYAAVSAAHQNEESFAAIGDPSELVSIAQASYEGGVMKILGLLDAYRTSLEMRLTLIDLRTTARQAEVDLDRALGKEVTR
jgi:cobalt-zinc-cadmium efflux system outer membrane protein